MQRRCVSYLSCMRATLRVARKIAFSELGASAKIAPIALLGKYTDVPLKPLEPKTPQAAPEALGPQPVLPKGGDMLRYIVQTMEKYPHAVVLTQVGSFYEMYFEHAIEFGPQLNLKIARKRQTSPRDEFPFVNMAGFPCYQLERYVKQLVSQLGKTVVLLEQDPSRIFTSTVEAEKRPVSRILTPGTLVAESFIDSSQNNFLAAINFTTAHVEKSTLSPTSPVSLAWVDLGAGAMFYQNTTFGALPNDLARISPKELLIEPAIHRDASTEALASLELARYTCTPMKFPGREAIAVSYAQRFCSARGADFSAHEMGPRAASAAGALVAYVDETLPGANLRFQPPVEHIAEDSLQIDARSRGALNIFATDGESAKGALFSVIRRTARASGARTLAQWLSEPRQDTKEISRRHDLVERFANDPKLASEILVRLRGMPDGKRLLQKLSMRRLDPLDLYAYSQAINSAKELAESFPDDAMFQQWKGPLKTLLEGTLKTAKKIARAINIDALIARPTEAVEPEEQKPQISQEAMSDVSYIPVLNPNVSKRLSDLYTSQQEFPNHKESLLQKLRSSFPEKAKIILRWSPLYRYHVHVKHDGLLDVPHEKVLARTKRTTNITEPEWQRLGLEREEFKSRLEKEELRILGKLREAVLDDQGAARDALNIIDEIDVIQSLAILATELQLVRPVMVEEPILDIENGRHISVETGLLLTGHNFVGNDCNLSRHKPLCMVTGPNMGGKSTYIRQTAIICLLAHIGSFVPADTATIGLVDRIFCRVGAGDDLFRGRSTFMMEMLETATILAQATGRSLAILDEVGRGTSGRDGVAIAYATIKHLIENNGSRALFATHFGKELFSLLKNADCDSAVQCLQAGIQMRDGGTFDYKLRDGICEDSQGLLIAELANFPATAIADAQAALGTSLNGMKSEVTK